MKLLVNGCSFSAGSSMQGSVPWLWPEVISENFSEVQYISKAGGSNDRILRQLLNDNNIKEGDYIELGQLGAYGLTFRTKFNGFYSDEIYELNDKPIMTIYEDPSKVDYLVA